MHLSEGSDLQPDENVVFMTGREWNCKKKASAVLRRRGHVRRFKQAMSSSQAT